MTLPKISDHVARALAFMLSQFDESERFRDVVSILVDQIQDLENDSYDSITERLLSTAVGVQLDVYGRLLGAARAGLSDDDFRALLDVRIRANQSEGVPDNIMGIVSDLIGVTPVNYARTIAGKAHFDLTWTDDTSPTLGLIDQLNAIMFEIAPAGVSWTLVEGRTTGGFRFDKAAPNGFDSGKLGRRVDVL